MIASRIFAQIRFQLAVECVQFVLIIFTGRGIINDNIDYFAMRGLKTEDGQAIVHSSEMRETGDDNGEEPMLIYEGSLRCFAGAYRSKCNWQTKKSATVNIIWKRFLHYKYRLRWVCRRHLR